MSSTLKRILLLALGGVVFLAGLAFYMRNDQRVVFDYFLGAEELPFTVWLLIALSIGVLLGWLAMVPVILSQRRQKSRLLRQLKAAEAEAGKSRITPHG